MEVVNNNMNALTDHMTLAAPLKNQRVYLLGLDFGSTTSSALVASALLSTSYCTGRMEFCDIRIEYRATPVFTPFTEKSFGQSIDISRITEHIHHWLAASHLRVANIFTGGSIITGLAALADNAQALTKVISEIIGDSVIATADDPSLESWMAFMGSVSTLSRYHGNTPILNIDIGGGTSNVALGIRGDVLSTGCYFIGARHFQFVVGSYQIQAISAYGAAILQTLNISANIGDKLNSEDCAAIMTFYVSALEAICMGDDDFFNNPLAKKHCQVPFSASNNTKAKITFSGGVGEFLYQISAGENLPSTTYFGDFGIDLARAISCSAILSANLKTHIPENKGRATVCGLTLHSTEISGHTIYLPKPTLLPLRDLPIIAKLAINSPSADWQSAFNLAANRKLGACIQIVDLKTTAAPMTLANIKLLAQTIKQHYARSTYSDGQTLLILLEANIGKVLGNYISDWGQAMPNLIVIDEIPIRHAHFVNVGRVHQQLVPISFFGLH
jgi:ethanolamine utilization protein EutA